ncbi:MAG TPA: nucleotide sugar dehydrogenase [Kofleriaceae bacterium]
MPPFDLDVAVIGGAGHVGLPLSLMFADRGLSTMIVDIDAAKIDRIRSGVMPFHEAGAPEMLARTLKSGKLEASTDASVVGRARYIVCIIGTPVDEHLNPSFTGIQGALEGCKKFFRDGQTFVLRSTVFPGVSAHTQRYFDGLGKKIRVAFCPERVAQGESLKEFQTLPQLISAFDPSTLAEMRTLFSFASEFIELEPMEAELCKLMTNAWRYIQFATTNQFYMIARDQGLDFDRILHGCRHNYPRMAGMPGPGFAAGPCLVKDTMQLAAFSQDRFVLGHTAMLINEGLPAFLVEQARRQVNLREATAGILGMAFKAGSDDGRDSLAYKLKKLLKLHAKQILCTDPHVPDPTLVSLDRVVEESDVLFVATPHQQYRTLAIPPGKAVFDVWSVLPKGQQ